VILSSFSPCEELFVSWLHLKQIYTYRNVTKREPVGINSAQRKEPRAQFDVCRILIKVFAVSNDKLITKQTRDGGDWVEHFEKAEEAT
jgi:hypothetical protein